MLRIPAAPALAFFLIVAITNPALAQKQADRVVPPAAFDRPFEGRLITVRAKNPEELREACRWPALPALSLGCANYISSSICVVIMASDEAIEAGINSAVHLSHSACAQRLDDLIWAELCSHGERHGTALYAQLQRRRGGGA